MSESIDEATATRLWQLGAATMHDVYDGRVPVVPEGAIAFSDVMMRTLFAQVWGRPGLELRDRRLLLLGVIAVIGDPRTFKIQCRAALDLEELTPDQLREVLVMLAPYAGYPRVAGLLAPAEEAIHEWSTDRDDGEG